MAEKKNIYQKLVIVRSAVSILKKDSRNDFHRFNYASSSAVLAAVRDAMNEQGLLLVPHVQKYWTTEHGKTAKGAMQYMTHFDMLYQWINAENPEETIICNWYAQGIDTNELGPGKAYTYGEKYFLLKFFNIPTDDHDPDASAGKSNSNSNKSAPKKPSGNGDGNGQWEKNRKRIWAKAIGIWGKEDAKNQLEEMCKGPGWNLRTMTEVQQKMLIESLAAMEAQNG